MFWFLYEACGILVPQPGTDDPVPPALEGTVLPLDLQGSPSLQSQY